MNRVVVECGGISSCGSLSDIEFLLWSAELERCDLLEVILSILERMFFDTNDNEARGSRSGYGRRT